jgi:hypothetical protein
MRRYWGTVALLIVAGLLGGYFIFIETPRERARLEEKEREGRVLSLKGDEVTKLEVETPSDRFVLERGDGGAWRVTAPVSAEADDGTVRRLLSQLESLSVVRAIDDIRDPAALGLDRPDVRVIASLRDGRAEAAFGDDNPAGSGVYVRRDDGKVFLTTPSAKATFEVSRDDIRRKEFVDFHPESVTDIAVSHRGHSVRVRREGGEWRIVDPPRTADPEVVSSLLSRLRALRATGFADTPEQRDALRVSAKPRTQVEVTAGETIVRVAIYQAGDGSFYAGASGPTLYKLNQSVVEALPLDAAALRDMRLVRVAFDDVRVAEVERDSEKYRVVRREDAWEIEGRRLKDAGAREFEAMIRSLTALRGESIAAETRSALPAKTFASPAARVTLRGTEDRELAVVTIGDASGERRYAFSESSGPVFWVAADIVNRIPSKSTVEAELATAQ